MRLSLVVSKDQYERMEELRCNIANQRPREVYVIFRVHNVTSKRIAAKVFVDPASLQQGGWLGYEATGWEVRSKTK